MADRDTFRLMTVGNINAMTLDELERRKVLLSNWLHFILKEIEFVDYKIHDKRKAQDSEGGKS